MDEDNSKELAMKNVKILLILLITTFTVNPVYAVNKSLIEVVFDIYEKVHNNHVNAPLDTVKPDKFVRGQGISKPVQITVIEPKSPVVNPEDVVEPNEYLVAFNERHLTNKQFIKAYYNRCMGCAYFRNGVTLKNATDREKIDLEKSLELKEYIKERNEYYTHKK